MNSKNFSINKKNKIWLKILISVAVSLVVLLVVNIFVSPIKNSFYFLSYPLQKNFWVAGELSSNFISSIFGAGELLEQNKNLQQENQKLLAQIAFLQSVEQANQAQSQVSISCQNDEFNLVMAGVIGLEDNDILSINKGSADGIAEGMPVISQQNVLFGKILRVYKNFSQVMLVSSKNSVVNVKVQQQDISLPEIDGVIKGSGGLSAYLDLIPVSSNINAGDILVTSAIEKSFPKDLLVAKIIKPQKDDQKPFQQAEVSPISDISSMDNLFVITNFKQPN